MASGSGESCDVEPAKKMLKLGSASDSPDSHSPLYHSDSSRSSLESAEKWWPSVTTDFDSFVKEHLFFASEHNSVKVVIKYDIHQQQIESFPLPKACDTCNTLFRRSNIANIVGDIEWEHVVGSMFDPNCLEKSLIPLASALRTVILRGAYNGYMREVVGCLVNVVRLHGLCPMHDMALDVNKPSSSSEIGGLRVRVDVQDKSGVTLMREMKAIPDLSILKEDNPFRFLAVAENKLRTQSWTKGARSSKSGRGQLFTYLLGAQIRHLQSVRHDPNAKVTPVFGLYIDELKMQSVVADLHRSKAGSHTLTLKVGRPSSSIKEGLISNLMILHKFLSTD